MRSTGRDLDLALAAQGHFVSDERDAVPERLHHIPAHAQANDGILSVGTGRRHVGRHADTAALVGQHVERGQVRGCLNTWPRHARTTCSP